MLFLSNAIRPPLWHQALAGHMGHREQNFGFQLKCVDLIKTIAFIKTQKL